MIKFCVDHPVATWMIFAALVLLGVYALPRLEIEAMPETELPSLTVVTTWNGASPAAVQRSLTIPIEEAARKVHGVEELVSRSQPGYSSVSVSFRRGTDMEFAQLDLSEQLGGIRGTLPNTAGQPRIVPYVPEEFRTDDFMTISLISPLSPNALRENAEDWLKSRLLSVQGVADVELQGGALPLWKVLLDYRMMDQYGLHSDQVFARIDALDEILPAGTIRDGGREIAVSLQDSVTVHKILDTIVANVGGHALTLDRIGDVVPDFDDPVYFVRNNGDNVIQASVAKRSGTNAVTVSRAVRKALPEIREAVPFAVEFEIDTDQGKELEDKLQELIYRSLAILGLLFILLAAALRRVRLTAIVVVSILFAIVICLTLFYFFDISVNFITISGLTVCFGMLLDNSILVLDAIHRRLVLRRHLDVKRTLVNGTREVAFPITATTLTTVVAFLSFIFLSGRLALYYVPLAVSVGIAMLASIFVAFAWIPVALRRTAEAELAKPEDEVADESDPEGFALLWRWAVAAVVITVIGYVALGFVQGWDEAEDLQRWFVGALLLMILVGAFASYVERITAMHLKYWVWPLVMVVGTLSGGWYLYKEEVTQGGFWQQPDREKLYCIIRREIGTDVRLTDATIRLFEAELLPLPEGVTMKTYSQNHYAQMEIDFDDETLRTAWPEEFRNRLIVLAEGMGGMRIVVFGFGDPYLKGGFFGLGGNSTVKITGYNSKQLEEITDLVTARLERNRRVRNVQLTGGERFVRGDTEESVIILDREAHARYHISVAETVGYLRRLLGIEYPWHMLLEGRDQRLQMSFADADQVQFDQIASHVMTTQDGNQVRLADLVELHEIPVVSTIHRENQRYSTHVNWEYIGTERMRQRYLQEIIAGIELPYGYTAEDTSGQQLTEEEEEEMNRMLILTAAFIFMTLAALFESVALPLLVLLSLPMAMSGVMGIFWLTDTDFDSSARIGLVLLFGIVVNNAILLVNRFRLQLREMLDDYPALRKRLPDHPRIGPWDLRRVSGATRDLLLRDAVCSGTRIQLRSILLTSGTTIAGMLPLLIRLSDVEGRDIWVNLALSSIGGLASSTVLIVGGIPTLYVISVRLGWWLATHVERLRRCALHAAVIAALSTAVAFWGGALAERFPELGLQLFSTRAWLNLDAGVVFAAPLWLAWMWLTHAFAPSLRWRSALDGLLTILISVPMTMLLVGIVQFAASSLTQPFAVFGTLILRQLTIGTVLALAAAILLLITLRRRGDDRAVGA